MGMRGRSRLFGNVREGGSFVSSSRAGFFFNSIHHFIVESGKKRATVPTLAVGPGNT